MESAEDIKCSELDTLCDQVLQKPSILFDFDIIKDRQINTDCTIIIGTFDVNNINKLLLKPDERSLNVCSKNSKKLFLSTQNILFLDTITFNADIFHGMPLSFTEKHVNIYSELMFTFRINKSLQAGFNLDKPILSVSIINTKLKTKTKHKFIKITSSNLKPDLQNEKKSFKSVSSNRYIEKGFFVAITVSERTTDLRFWLSFLQNTLKENNFDIDYCCKFTEFLNLSFQAKIDAINTIRKLRRLKRATKNRRNHHLTYVGKLKRSLSRPCNCEEQTIQNCLKYFKEFSEKYITEHQAKILALEEDLEFLDYDEDSTKQKSNLKGALDCLYSIERVFKNHVCNLKTNLYQVSNYFDVCRLQSNFSRECNSLKRSLPVYSKKDEIISLLEHHSVLVISAATGSGKSTQLVEYMLQLELSQTGVIICTQPRKIAAISIAKYIAVQLGTALGKLVDYDIGMNKKFSKETRIIYMTDYALLRRLLNNRKLTGVSCLIIDEAHERTLFTDLLLGMIKQSAQQEQLGFKLIVTSATIDPQIFVKYFNLLSVAVIDIPGRNYPVEVVWLDRDVEIGWNYVLASVETAIEIHTRESVGDILVFLTSPSEIDEAIFLFKEIYSGPDMPYLMSLHGKSELNEQMLVFQSFSDQTRKIVFTTNVAETSLTIPGMKYVVDSGMAKELVYFSEKNKNCLMVNFINQSSAEQRKGRAGRTQPGVCYRMYSENNFKNMPIQPCPEILKTNLQRVLLKIYEFGFCPEDFDFIDPPPRQGLIKSLESLKQLGLTNRNGLTDLGKKVVKLPIEPRLAKLVMEGISEGVGYEMVIIAAVVGEAGRLYIRPEDSRSQADRKKVELCQDSGDLCTYLEIFKCWKAVLKHERNLWCSENFISSKAIYSAAKTIDEIVICLDQELSIHLVRCYNDFIFKNKFEELILKSFSDNLCVFSGHQTIGYFSLDTKNSLFIHPSSSIYYLGAALPVFLVYTSLTETSKHFLLDVTPITEETINKVLEFEKVSEIKSLQLPPKTLGPFGESILIRHAIGKDGSKVKEMESVIKAAINSKKLRIEVIVDKGTIQFWSEECFHKVVADMILKILEKSCTDMANEEITINTFNNFYTLFLTKGGIISDILMPGEFKELKIKKLKKIHLDNTVKILHDMEDLHLVKVEATLGLFEISVAFKKVVNASKAFLNLKQKGFSVTPVISVSKQMKSQASFKFQVTWSRCLSDGTGFVEFNSEIECSKALTLLHNSITSIHSFNVQFLPSKLSRKEIEIKNLPEHVDKNIVKKNLSKILTHDIKLRSIHVRQKKLNSISKDGLHYAENKILQLFNRFALNEVKVEVKYPEPKDISWEATVYFKNFANGEKAFKELQGKALIDSIPVQIRLVIDSVFYVRTVVFDVIWEDIECLLGELDVIMCVRHKNKSTVGLHLSCKSLTDLKSLRQRLISLLKGHSIECSGNINYLHLFNNTCNKNFILEIQQHTKTYIELNETKKLILIYGQKQNCLQAHREISCIMENKYCRTDAFVKSFNLKNSCLPNGFLKTLYKLYELNLRGLVSQFDLDAADLDIAGGLLTLKGTSTSIVEAERNLEEICCELYNKRKIPSTEMTEKCPTCMDPLNFDYYRLENCGHAFCKECLILQMESKNIPLICREQDCSKDFFVIDIKRLLSIGGDTLQKKFSEAALQYYISRNCDTVFYCPSPGCKAICRKSEDDTQIQCPLCENILCAHCQMFYHYGMSCDKFQKYEKRDNNS